MRTFVRKEVVPVESLIDDEDRILVRLIAQAKTTGLYGYALPTEYGGLGLSMEEQVRGAVELGRVHQSGVPVAVRNQ